MARIFISYRRDDSAGYVLSLVEHLRQRFGPQEVFHDIRSLEPGEDFVEIIERQVISCSVLIAVIGRHWLNIADETGQRRLDNPEDFVRLEIMAALKRNIRVIPVLVQRAKMPRSNQVPEVLVGLTRRHAHELSDQRWEYDVEQLIIFLEKMLPKIEQEHGQMVLEQPSAFSGTQTEVDKAEVDTFARAATKTASPVMNVVEESHPSNKQNLTIPMRSNIVTATNIHTPSSQWSESSSVLLFLSVIAGINILIGAAVYLFIQFFLNQDINFFHTIVYSIIGGYISIMAALFFNLEFFPGKAASHGCFDMITYFIINAGVGVIGAILSVFLLAPWVGITFPQASWSLAEFLGPIFGTLIFVAIFYWIKRRIIR